MAYPYTPPTQQGKGYPQQQQYSPQPVHHHTIIVQQQPVVVPPRVQQPTVRHQSNDLLRGLGRAVDSAATDLFKATVVVGKEVGKEMGKEVAKAVVTPIDLLKPGYVVQIVSKVCGKSLRVLENGSVDCGGERGTSCEFCVVSSGSNAIKLRNIAQPKFYLAITNGYLIGYGQGGFDCDLIPAATLDHHVTFESAQSPGSHIGVLPSGQITAPAQTTKQTDASHFKIKFLRTLK